MRKTRDGKYGSQVSGMWNFMKLNILQCYGMLVLSFTLMKRRWFLFFAYLLVPIIGFTYVAIMDRITLNYVKPNFDAALRRDSPYASPHTVDLKSYILPELQCLLALSLWKNKSVVPNRLLFTTSENVKVDDVKNLFFKYGKLSNVFNILDYDLKKFEKSGSHRTPEVVLDWIRSGNIDNLLYNSLLSEEFDGVSNEFIGSFSMEKMSGDSLSYVIQYEQKMDRRDTAIGFQSSLLSLKNNYSEYSDFCKWIGYSIHSFECENFISSFLIHFVDSAFILRETGIMTQSRIGHLPYHSEGFKFNPNLGDLRIIFWLPLILASCLSLFSHVLVSDKDYGTRKVMEMMGLRTSNYLISKYIVFFLYYIPYVGFAYIYGLYVLKFRIFTQVDFLLIWLIFIGSGFLSISFSFLFSTFFQSSVIMMIFAKFVEYVIPCFMSDIRFQMGDSNNWKKKLLSLVYPFPMVDCIMNMYKSVGENQMYIHFDHVYRNKDFLVSLISMFFVAGVYVIVYYVIQKILNNATINPRYRIATRIIDKLASYLGCFKSIIWWCFGFPYSEDGEHYLNIGIKKVVMEDEDVQKIRILCSSIKNAKEYGIVIKNLRKRFSVTGRWVLDGISFKVDRNSVYGLLGDNGAGKTSIIKIITGEISPTEICGIFVDGKDVLVSGLSSVASSIGVCKQFDVLYEDLSVEEHLSLFSCIRGIDFRYQHEHIRSILELTSLLEETSNPVLFHESNSSFWKYLDGIFQFSTLFGVFKPLRKVCELSGGNRRKLSIAIALTGFPDIILLDEPTSGLDCSAQRSIWKIIRKLGKEKSIILTTHDMVEAETLCDEIGIIKEGKLVATGTSNQLKEKFGNEFRFRIKLYPDASKKKLNKFMKLVSKKNRKVKLIFDYGLTLVWGILFVSDDQKEEFCQAVDRVKNAVGIRIWCLEKCSLSDIFVKLIGEEYVEDTKFEKSKSLGGNSTFEEYSKLKDCTSSEDDAFTDTSSSSSYRSYSSTSTSSSSSEEDEGGNNFDSSDTTKEATDFSSSSKFSPPSSSSSSSSDSDISNNSTSRNESLIEPNQLKIFWLQFYVLLKKEFLLTIRWPILFIFTVCFASIVIFELWIIYKMASLPDSKSYFDPEELESSLFSEKCKSWISEECYHFVYTTNGNKRGSGVIEYVIDRLKENNAGDVSYLQTKEFENSEYLLDWVYDHPNQTYHSILIDSRDQIELPNNTISIPLLDNLKHMKKYLKNFNNLKKSFRVFPFLSYTILFNSTKVDSPRNDLPISTTSYLQVLMDEGIMNVSSGIGSSKEYKINVKRRKAPMYPLKDRPKRHDVWHEIGPCFYGIAFCFVVTVVGMIFIRRKQIGFHENVIISGTYRFALYLSYLVYFCVMCVISSFIAFFVSIILQVDVILYTNPIISISLFVLYNFSLLAFASVFLPFLTNERMGIAVYAIWMLVIFFTGAMFDSTLVISIHDVSSFWEYFLMYFLFPIFFPPLSFCKIYSDISYKTVPKFDYDKKKFVDNVGYGFSDLFISNKIEQLSLESGPSIYWFGYLIINIVLYMGLGFFFYYLVESKFYCFDCILKPLIFGIFRKSKEDEEEEEEEVGENDLESVIVQNLSKTRVKLFPGVRRRKILDGVSFVSPRNELLGIIGSNGAGKSTLLHMITGSLRITEGNIKVYEPNSRMDSLRNKKFVEVKKQIGDVRRILGFVPQHDILIHCFKAKEILELFALCKGLKWDVVQHRTKELLRKVGLPGSQYIGSFSGGMMRKLSIAMALVSEPSLVLLDEPTTGIDVYSCYQIWKLFFELKYSSNIKSSIIMTSHKLDEIELLSDRVAILNDRNIEVIDDPTNLRKFYGCDNILESDSSDKNDFDVTF